MDAVVVAGDVFDDNAVGEDSLQRARDALAAVRADPGAAPPGQPRRGHARLRPRGASAPAITCTRSSTTRRSSSRTPASTPARSAAVTSGTTRRARSRRARAGDPILVAIAHGALIDFTEGLESKNVIDWRGVLAKGYDYLALGDWHGTLSFDPRVWYSGAPEPTRFKEKRPGNALVVEIDAPGAMPRVEEIAVARTRWIERRFDLASDDARGRGRALLRLGRRAVDDARERAPGGARVARRRGPRLDELLAQARGSLMHLRVDDDGASRPPERGGPAHARRWTASSDARPRRCARRRGRRAAEDALRLLHRFVVEERR